MDLLTELEAAKIATYNGAPHDLEPLAEELAATTLIVATATTADTLEWNEDYPTLAGMVGMCEALDWLYAGDPDVAEYFIAVTAVAVQTWTAAHPEAA